MEPSGPLLSQGNFVLSYTRNLMFQYGSWNSRNMNRNRLC